MWGTLLPLYLAPAETPRAGRKAGTPVGLCASWLWGPVLLLTIGDHEPNQDWRPVGVTFGHRCVTELSPTATAAPNGASALGAVPVYGCECLGGGEAQTILRFGEAWGDGGGEAGLWLSRKTDRLSCSSAAWGWLQGLLPDGGYRPSGGIPDVLQMFH